VTSPALPFYDNALLFGHDRTTGLLAFELEAGDRIQIFSRQGDEELNGIRGHRLALLGDPLTDPLAKRPSPGGAKVEEEADPRLP